MSEITVHPTPVGLRYLYAGTAVILRDDLPGIGGNTLADMMGRLKEVHDEAVASYRPEKVPEVARERMGPRAFAATGHAFDEAKAYHRAANEADARIMTPVEPVAPEVAVEARQGLRSLDRAGQAQAVNQADLIDLTALVASGNRVPLEGPVWDRAVERFREENVMLQMSLPAQHPAIATVERPLATGPDMEAARAAAREKLAEHNDRLERVEQAQRSATELLVFLAAVFDMTPAAVLDEVMGRADG
jgi:hypothetical protein